MNDDWDHQQILNAINRARTANSEFDFELSVVVNTFEHAILTLIENPKIPTHILAHIVLNSEWETARKDAGKSLLNRAIADEVVEAIKLPIDWIANLYVDETMILRIRKAMGF